jgi:hypothetical protein
MLLTYAASDLVQLIQKRLTTSNPVLSHPQRGSDV